MPSDFEEYMQAQIHEIELAKWYEGERIGEDPGAEFIRDWINKNSQSFRNNWNKEHK